MIFFSQEFFPEWNHRKRRRFDKTKTTSWHDVRPGQQSLAERSLLSQRFHVNRRHLVARGDDTGILYSIQVEQGEAPVVVSEIKQWILREIIQKREPEDIFRDNANDPNMFCVISLQELGKELRYTLTDLDSTEVARQVTLRVSIGQFIGYIDTYKRYCNFCLKCDENARTLWKIYLFTLTHF
jgi:hypothetical protein